MSNKLPFRWIDGTLYIRMDVLVELGIRQITIRKGYINNRDGWQKIDDPEDRRSVLIAYEPMWQQYKDLVVAKYGDPKAYLAVTQRITSAPPVQLVEFYGSQLLHRCDAERTETAVGYALVAMVIERCATIGAKDCKQLGFDGKEALLEAVLRVMQQERERFPVKIGSLQVLRRHLTAYTKALKNSQEAAYMSLLAEGKKAGNKNAAKLGDEEVRFLIALMGHQQKPQYSVVCRLYNEKAMNMGWADISERTLRRYLEQPNIKQMWWLPRHGSEAQYQKYDPSAKRKKASRKNALWVMDGTPLDLYYQHTTEQYNEKTGKWDSKTSYYNRLYLYMVIDAASWAIVGYVLCETENHTAVVGALRNAVRKMQVLPKQIQRDRGSAGEMVEGLIKKLALYDIPSAPYNPKSKVVEAVFGHFQQEVLRYNDNWAGQNIRAKKLDSRFNPDELGKLKKDLPTRSELEKSVAVMIEVWNNYATEERKAPNEMLAGLEQAGRSYELDTFIDLFWVLTPKTYKYHQSGITITINKQEYSFATYEPELYMQLVHQQFQLKYDPEDMDYVYLYQNDKPVLDSDGQHVILEKAHRLPMAIDDYQEGDGDKIGAVKKLKKAVKEQAESNLEQVRKWQQEEGLKLGVKNVHKAAFNAAESAIKRSLIADEDNNSYKWYDDPYGN